MSCVLRFSAKGFDVASYLKESLLVPAEVFKPGDYNQTALESWITKYPGFCVTTSQADFNDFKTQLADTAAFIHANKQELIKLSQLPDVVSFFYDFGLETTLFQEDVWVDAFCFPIEFLRLLCAVGASMEISYYYPSSEADD